VVSGNIFVYKRDKNTNLTRWTDGVNWSPSRLQGPFIFYREIQDPPQGHRKNNKAKNPNAIANPNSDREALRLRPFIAALYDTYMFKPGGLIKKSFAGKVGNDDWHVVAYYTLQDLPNLHRVRALDPHLMLMQPPRELLDRGGKEPITDDGCMGGVLQPEMWEKGTVIYPGSPAVYLALATQIQTQTQPTPQTHGLPMHQHVPLQAAGPTQHQHQHPPLPPQQVMLPVQQPPGILIPAQLPPDPHCLRLQQQEEDQLVLLDQQRRQQQQQQQQQQPATWQDGGLPSSSDPTQQQQQRQRQQQQRHESFDSVTSAPSPNVKMDLDDNSPWLPQAHRESDFVGYPFSSDGMFESEDEFSGLLEQHVANNHEGCGLY
jgi:hypothetical protein